MSVVSLVTLLVNAVYALVLEDLAVAVVAVELLPDIAGAQAMGEGAQALVIGLQDDAVSHLLGVAVAAIASHLLISVAVMNHPLISVAVMNHPLISVDVMNHQLMLTGILLRKRGSEA